MTLGARIKALRQQSKLSQEQVAERLGITRQAVTKWETGQSAPSTENLIKLTQIFNCPLDALIQPEPAPAPKPPSRKRRPNWKAAFLFLGIYLCWFLVCKLLWAELGNQTVLHWLLGDDPKYHAYLFGWLLDKFWFCALIGVLPALFGKCHFSGTATGGFVLGMMLGEFLGDLDGLVPSGYHYGWAIWGGIWLASIGFGIMLQRMSPENRQLSSQKMRIFCIAAGCCVLAVVLFVLLNIPRHTGF